MRYALIIVALAGCTPVDAEPERSECALDGDCGRTGVCSEGRCEACVPSPRDAGGAFGRCAPRESGDATPAASPPSQPEDECGVDDECGPNGICENFQCQRVAPCSTSAQCGEWETCWSTGRGEGGAAAYCRFSEQQCEDAAQCGDGQACQGGACLDAWDEPESECGVDSDCGPDGVCDGYSCLGVSTCSTAADCLEYETCVPNDRQEGGAMAFCWVAPEQCQVDDQCQGLACVDGACVNPPADCDCGGEGRCVDGACEDPRDCEDDAECDEGERCEADDEGDRGGRGLCVPA